MPTVIINADDPIPSPPEALDGAFATEAQKYAAQAQSAARSAGANRDAIEEILQDVELGAAFISSDAKNRLKRGQDGGYFVSDDLVPDPLAHYILAKG